MKCTSQVKIRWGPLDKVEWNTLSKSHLVKAALIPHLSGSQWKLHPHFFGYTDKLQTHRQDNLALFIGGCKGPHTHTHTLAPLELRDKYSI